MREIFTYGSVGRAPGNRCLYPENDPNDLNDIIIHNSSFDPNSRSVFHRDESNHYNMSQLKKTLISRLKNEGMEPSIIQGFIRSFSNILYVNPDINFWQIKKRLQYLGWDDFELDYYTFQLVIEYLDATTLSSQQTKPIEL